MTVDTERVLKHSSIDKSDNPCCWPQLNSVCTKQKTFSMCGKPFWLRLWLTVVHWKISSIAGFTKKRWEGIYDYYNVECQ